MSGDAIWIPRGIAESVLRHAAGDLQSASTAACITLHVLACEAERSLAASPETQLRLPGAHLPMSVTQADFRKAMGCFATGVTVITVDYEGEIHGMTANAFTSVSLDSLLVLVCVDQKARTHAHLHAKKRFGVNVLAEEQRVISDYYARPMRTHEKAEEEAGARFDRTAHGTPVMQGALAYLEG